MPYGIIQQQIMQVEIYFAVVFITSQTYYFFAKVFKIITTYQKRLDHDMPAIPIKKPI
jgi:hypothetical protein